jgi:hypothetical protein
MLKSSFNFLCAPHSYAFELKFHLDAADHSLDPKTQSFLRRNEGMYGVMIHRRDDKEDTIRASCMHIVYTDTEVDIVRKQGAWYSEYYEVTLSKTDLDPPLLKFHLDKDPIYKGWRDNDKPPERAKCLLTSLRIEIGFWKPIYPQVSMFDGLVSQRSKYKPVLWHINDAGSSDLSHQSLFQENLLGEYIDLPWPLERTDSVVAMRNVADPTAHYIVRTKFDAGPGVLHYKYKVHVDGALVCAFVHSTRNADLGKAGRIDFKYNGEDYWIVFSTDPPPFDASKAYARTVQINAKERRKEALLKEQEEAAMRLRWPDGVRIVWPEEARLRRPEAAAGARLRRPEAAAGARLRGREAAAGAQ